MVKKILNDLIRQKKLSLETLGIVTRSESCELQKFLAGEDTELTSDQIGYLGDIAMMLTVGVEEIPDDKRIAAIIDALEGVYKLDKKAISLLTKIDENIIAAVHSNPEQVPWKEKYQVAIKVYMIFYLFKYPNNQIRYQC